MDELWACRIELSDGTVSGYITACEDGDDAKNVFRTLANDLDGRLIEVMSAVDMLDGSIMELNTF